MAEGVRLDLGCGKNKKEGFIGVDTLAFDGVDIVCNLAELVWNVKPEYNPKVKEFPLFEADGVYRFKHDSVDEVYSSHFLEHLTGRERVNFYNELYRILKPGAKATIIVPHWGSGRAYGDPTHQWLPVVEESFFYLDKGWREGNAPHCGLDCNFHAVWWHVIRADWNGKSPEAQAFAVNHYRGVAQDLMATLTKQ